MNLKKILIAVDNSKCAEKAAKAGYEMAEKFAAEVALVNIIQPMPVNMETNVSPNEIYAPVFIENFENVEENSMVLLKEIENQFSKGLKTSYLSILDTPAHGIIKQAEEWGADLIVIGTYGHTGFYHFLMGSVAEHVARKSACPVLIIPNKYEEG